MLQQVPKRSPTGSLVSYTITPCLYSLSSPSLTILPYNWTTSSSINLCICLSKTSLEDLMHLTYKGLKSFNLVAYLHSCPSVSPIFTKSWPRLPHHHPNWNVSLGLSSSWMSQLTSKLTPMLFMNQPHSPTSISAWSSTPSCATHRTTTFPFYPIHVLRYHPGVRSASTGSILSMRRESLLGAVIGFKWCESQHKKQHHDHYTHCTSLLIFKTSCCCLTSLLLDHRRLPIRR